MSIIRIETICGPPQLFEIYAVVRFTPLRGRRTPGGADRGVPKIDRNRLVTPDFYIVVHCNYGSIWLRFRDMIRDRQTDGQKDRQTSAPFNDMATRSGSHNNYPSGLTAYVPPDPTQVDSSQLDCEQSCKSTQLNYHKMTGFFCRPIRLKSTQVIWTVDTLKGQLSSSELDGGAFCPTRFCSKSLKGGGDLRNFVRGELCPAIEDIFSADDKYSFSFLFIFSDVLT